MTDVESEREIFDLIKRAMTVATKGCCGGPAWRGRFCTYHQGYEEGLETGLMSSFRALHIDGSQHGEDA